MGSTDTSGSFTYMSYCETADNGDAMRIPNIFLNGQTSNRKASNGKEGLVMNLDASTQTQMKAEDRKGLTGYIASIILLPMLIPVTLVYMIVSQLFSKLSFSMKEEFAEPPPVDTGYRCKRHSICIPSADNPLDLLRHDSRELIQNSNSATDLRFDIRPELLDATTPMSRSRRGSFSSRRQTLRRNSSVPLMHRQPKYITPDNLLWQLMMLPILVPLWFLDVFISIVSSPMHILRRLTYGAPIELSPLPIRRRGSVSMHSGRPGHKPLVFPVNHGAPNLYSGPPSPSHSTQMYLDPGLY
ncbi:hypothetical protein LSAT2_011484 [Lamellibrachia satsuma]|nr:hypothetical protein LSAT2_011484 [Lamellibrachia satsuma]